MNWYVMPREIVDAVSKSKIRIVYSVSILFIPLPRSQSAAVVDPRLFVPDWFVDSLFLVEVIRWFKAG